MQLKGLQKLTLLDYPEKIACTVFTAGCNFRCPFCHNASLVCHVAPSFLSEEDFFKFLKQRVGILEGVCVTGGEPTLQEDLAPFLKQIKSLGFSVKLDTNGYSPDVLKRLVWEGLVDYVAMDIKNSLQKYPETVGIAAFDPKPILESVAFLLSAPVEYEFRTTVVRELHTAEDLLSIADWIGGARRYYLQAFLDSGDLIKSGLSGYGKQEMEALLNLVKERLPVCALRGV